MNLPSLSSGHFIFQGHPAAWNTISKHIKVKTFSKEESVLCHGDDAHSLFVMLQGWVSLTRQTPDGKETITGLLTEGDVFGEASLFPNASYPYNAAAVDDSTQIAIIPSRIMREAIKNDKEFSTGIMGLLNERLTKTQLKLEHLSTLSAAQRMGCFLLNLCKDTSHGSKTIHIPVGKNIIAAYLGMKAETFSRSLQQLKDVGIKASGHTIDIEKIEDLRDFVCNSCSEFGACDTNTYTHS